MDGDFDIHQYRRVMKNAPTHLLTGEKHKRKEPAKECPDPGCRKYFYDGYACHTCRRK
jgi:hypothetical protein